MFKLSLVKLCVGIVTVWCLLLLVAVVTNTASGGEYWQKVGQYLPTDLTPAQQKWIGSAKDRRGTSCCSTADGYRPDEEDIEWDQEKGQFKVKLDGEWNFVDDNQLVDAPMNLPNPIGRAIAWWYMNTDDAGGPLGRRIRCFAPGAGG